MILLPWPSSIVLGLGEDGTVGSGGLCRAATFDQRPAECTTSAPAWGGRWCRGLQGSGRGADSYTEEAYVAVQAPMGWRANASHAVSFDVTKDEHRVAVLTFVKSSYRLGETVLGVMEFNDPSSKAKVLKVRGVPNLTNQD